MNTITRSGAAAVLGLLMTVGGAAAVQAAPVGMGSVALAVTDSHLSDQEQLTTTQGKRVSSQVFYNRSANRLTTTLSVSSPFLFYGARGTATTTVYSAAWVPLWTVTHSLTACGVWDACSSDVTSTLQHTPPASVAGTVHRDGAYVTTSVAVS